MYTAFRYSSLNNDRNKSIDPKYLKSGSVQSHRFPGPRRSEHARRDLGERPRRIGPLLGVPDRQTDEGAEDGARWVLVFVRQLDAVAVVRVPGELGVRGEYLGPALAPRGLRGGRRRHAPVGAHQGQFAVLGLGVELDGGHSVGGGRRCGGTGGHLQEDERRGVALKRPTQLQRRLRLRTIES